MSDADARRACRLLNLIAPATVYLALPIVVGPDPSIVPPGLFFVAALALGFAMLILNRLFG